MVLDLGTNIGKLAWINTSSFHRSPVMSEERMRPGLRLGSSLWASFIILILLVGGIELNILDTIRDAILMCTQKPTWVCLIYRTELTTKKCKTKKRICWSVHSWHKLSPTTTQRTCWIGLVFGGSWAGIFTQTRQPCHCSLLCKHADLRCN